MDENDKIEKGLKEFRESRDRELPADRRLLPVHKDRLLAEARRRYSAKSAPAWIAFFRPAVRWAVVAAPVLILALAGYFWFQDKKVDRAVSPARVVLEQERVVLLDGRETMALPRKSEDRTRSLRKEDMDTFSDLAQAPAESAAGDRSYDEAKTVLASPPVPSETLGASSMAAAGGTIAQNEPAQMQMAMLNLSGQYRTQAQARDQLQVRGNVAKGPASAPEDKAAGKDEKNADAETNFEEGRRAKVGNAPDANFSNFKLTQSADHLTLVDADGSVYVGRMVQTQQAGNKLAAKEKSKSLSRQDVSNLIQQANLVGTNRLTREVVNLVANFYVEPADSEVASELGESDGAVIPAEMKEAAKSVEAPLQKKQRVEKLSSVASAKPGSSATKPAAVAPVQSNVRNQVQNAQAPIRVSVVLERMDLKNNRQEAISNADRVSE